MSKWVRRIATLVIGAVLMSPAVLWAHARLTRSDPAAGARLEIAPSVIRLWFSEAPEIALSSIVLKDSGGASVTLGAVEKDSSKLGIRAAVTSRMAPGSYTLTWHVAAADGHPTSGSYSFVVVAPASAAAVDTAKPRTTEMTPMTPAAATTEVTAETPAYVATRAAEFAALLMLIGCVAFRFGVVGRADGIAAELRPVLYGRLAIAGLVAVLVLLVADAVRLQLQQAILANEPSHIVHMRILAENTEWGRAWLVQVGAALVVGVALWLGRRGQVAAWTIAALGAIALGFSPAFGGHAAASESSRWLAIAADGLHVLAAAGWMGSLVCLAIVALPLATRAGDDRLQAIASLVRAFSPLAMVCAATVALTGLVSGWLRLGGLEPLWTSTYGRTLLIKLALVAGVAATGAYNWLRVKPTLGTAPATSRLKVSATTELAIGAAVVIVTAILVALPTPMDVGR